MKKILVVGIGALILTNISYAEINLRDSYGNKTMWGYNGFEIRSNYKNISLNGQEKTKLYDLKNSSIKNSLEELTSYLELENKDTENLLSVGYDGLNSNLYKNNDYSILLGKSNNNSDRIGLKLDFINGKYKVKDNNLKEKDYAGTMFYSAKNFNILGYLGKNEIKGDTENSKNLYYGVYGKWKKELVNYSYYFETFEYLEPSIYFDTQLQRYTIKNLDSKKHNDSLNSSVGIEFKNNVDFDNFNLTTTFNIGYNREFLENKKYKSFDIKEKSLDTLITGLDINLKYTETTDIFIGYSIKKSLNNEKYLNQGKIGFKIRF